MQTAKLSYREARGVWDAENFSGKYISSGADA
jgi:hypothetical protein